MKQNCVVNKEYPAQMLEVPGDLRRAPAKFENPVYVAFRCLAHLFNDLGKVFCENPFADMSFNGSSPCWQRDCKPQLTEKKVKKQ